MVRQLKTGRHRSLEKTLGEKGEIQWPRPPFCADIEARMDALKIKICGLTNLEDAEAAVRAGADALGFVFYPRSPRAVTVEQAAEIVRRLPPLVSKVAVLVNPSEELIVKALESGMDTLQFHGEETPEQCRRWPVKVIKAFRVEDESSLLACRPFDREAWLLDSFVEGSAGGTGKTFNWELAARARQWHPWIILAGGLHERNVGQAVRAVRPYAVDVSSGVELKPGKKDLEKLAAFIAAARAASASHD